MDMKRVVFATSIVFLVSANQSKEILCKARPGCLLTKCDPTNSLETLNTNEYPLTCFGTSVQDQAVKAEYDKLKKQLERLRTDMDVHKSEISKLQKSNAELVEENKIIKSEASEWRKKISELSIENELMKSEASELRNISNELSRAFFGRSCHGAKLESALARNDSGGVFDLYIPTIGIRGVFCDVTDEGGNWTVFQRRVNGDIDFFRGWDDYVKGFGDLQGDFWLGLEALHRMTRGGNYELKIIMTLLNGDRYFAKYSSFQVGSGSDKYRLRLSGFSGSAKRDSFIRHDNRQFTTKDADHDAAASYNCALPFEGGWWYENCADSNLNGNFKTADRGGVWWRSYYGPRAYLRYTEMKFRGRLQ